MRFASLVLFLCVVLCSEQANGQARKSLALFSLTAESIEAIGIDGDLLFTMREELGRADDFQLLSRREMEEGLYRINGAQVSDPGLVVQYGRGLGVNYVLTGSVNVERSAIVVNFLLVDVNHEIIADRWQERFSTKNELVTRAPAIASSLLGRIQRAEQMTSPAASTNVEVLTAFEARAVGEKVALNWRLAASASAFYYNLYRGDAVDGPFQFLSSVSQTSYTDEQLERSGSYFYRLGIILDDGNEVTGEIIASADVRVTEADTSLASPSVLQSKPHVNGLSVTFVPSSANTQKSVGYQVYYRTGGAQWQKADYARDSGAISYTITLKNRFDAGQVYEVALSSVFADGVESPLSDPITVTALAPPQLSISAEERTRVIHLQVNDVVQGTTLKLYRREENTETWISLPSAAADSQGLIMDSHQLADGKSYEYAATYADAVSETPRSAVVIGRTKQLSAPLSLLAAGGVKSVSLQWEPVNDADVVGYTIFRKQGDLTQDDLLDEVAKVDGANTTTYSDGSQAKNALLDGEHYHYVVAARNRFGGLGRPSPTASAQTKPLPAGADAPEMIALADLIRVKWQPSTATDLASYQLLRSWNGQAFVPIAKLDADVTTYDDNDLKPYAETRYQVVAIDKDGLQSAPVVSASVLSPESVQLSVTQEGELRRIGLAWTEHKHIDGYRLYRRASGGSWEFVVSLARTQTSYVDMDSKKLAEGSRYEYQVRAFDASQEMPPSNTVTATTKPVPAPPENLTASERLVKSVMLEWSPIADSDVAGYKIYRLDSGKPDLIETIKTPSTSRFLDKGSFFKALDDGTRYRYQVSAYNRFNVEGVSSIVVEGATKPLPAAPQGLSVTAAGGSVELRWQSNAETDIAYYLIFRGTSCSSVREHARASTTAYVDSDMTAGRAYCYRVAAVDKDQLEGAKSDAQQIDIPSL